MNLPKCSRCDDVLWVLRKSTTRHYLAQIDSTRVDRVSWLEEKNKKKESGLSFSCGKCGGDFGEMQEEYSYKVEGNKFLLQSRGFEKFFDIQGE